MTINAQREFRADLQKVGIKDDWYTMEVGGNIILVYDKYYKKFFDKFKYIGIEANISIKPEDTKKIGGNHRWIILGIGVGFDYNRGSYTFKVIDGFDKKNDIEKVDRPLMGASSVELLKSLVRSELKKAFEEKGIVIKNYKNKK